MSGRSPMLLARVRSDLLHQELGVIVSLAIGLVLFEGGLTLDLRGYRPVAAVVRRLLSVGLLATWIITAGAVRLIFAADWSFALLAASLVIVTGPTVIAPLLKRVKVRPNLHSILHWEGVLIDPLGVFVAILCFEWIGAESREWVLARFIFPRRQGCRRFCQLPWSPRLGCYLIGTESDR